MRAVAYHHGATLDVLTRHLSILPFEDRIRREGVRLNCERIDTVQINLGKLCNQSCTHCHVEASPHRTEIMTHEMAELTADFVRAAEAQTVDLTGGAPELNPSFRWLVERLVSDGRRVIDRCNLTVFLEPGQEETPEFLASLGIEIVASLPCYTQENVDQQRGRGVYAKSIQALRRLNSLGYGKEDSDLVLNLVYNPLGACLPGPQQQLEDDYRQELNQRFGISFSRLHTMTNMPMGRFARCLQSSNEYDSYWLSLANAFNASTVSRLMCRNMVSVSWDGFLYDCDFNQMLGLPLRNGKPFRLGESPVKEIVRQLLKRDVLVGPQCYACTAGAGSSCQGALQ